MAFGGPGQGAGLRVGDIVMEVNGQNVEEKHLEEVIMLVKEGGHFLSLLVMDKPDDSKEKQTETTTKDISDSEVKEQITQSNLFSSLLRYQFP